MAMQSKGNWWLDDTKSLYAWVTLQMLKGAAYSAILFFGCILFVLVLKWIGELLPDDPYALLDMGRGVTQALV